uniref:Uncharacterized protein n=1 Tax=Strigamia maritima TaxID=126957 RepID=T1J0W1_STRMM
MPYLQRLCFPRQQGCTTFSISRYRDCVLIRAPPPFRYRQKTANRVSDGEQDLIACSCIPVHGRFTGHVPTLLSEMYNLAVRLKLPSAIKLGIYAKTTVQGMIL